MAEQGSKKQGETLQNTCPFHSTTQPISLTPMYHLWDECIGQEMGLLTTWRSPRQKGATAPLSSLVGNGLLWLPSSGPNGRLGHGLRTHLLLESY